MTMDSYRDMDPATGERVNDITSGLTPTAAQIAASEAQHGPVLSSGYTRSQIAKISESYSIEDQMEDIRCGKRPAQLKPEVLRFTLKSIERSLRHTAIELNCLVPADLETMRDELEEIELRLWLMHSALRLKVFEVETQIIYKPGQSTPLPHHHHPPAAVAA